MSQNEPVLKSAIEAERHVSRFDERGGRGIVLRFSSIYGPGRVSAEYVEAATERKLPR
jgi:hypothetical protein